jgi:hypothetical protein
LDDEPNIRDVARECLEICNGDVADATKEMIGRVHRSRGLRDALTAPLIDGACYDAIRSEQHANRRVIWNTTNKSGEDPGERFRKFATASLMDFPLLNGKRLGDAEREEVSGTQKFYEAQSRSMGVRAAWLRLILVKLPPHKKVGDVLTEKQLLAMQVAAERSFKEIANAAE